MKLMEAIGTAALSLILAVGVSALPQKEQHEQGVNITINVTL